MAARRDPVSGSGAAVRARAPVDPAGRCRPLPRSRARGGPPTPAGRRDRRNSCSWLPPDPAPAWSRSLNGCLSPADNVPCCPADAPRPPPVTDRHSPSCRGGAPASPCLLAAPPAPDPSGPAVQGGRSGPPPHPTPSHCGSVPERHGAGGARGFLRGVTAPCASVSPPVSWGRGAQPWAVVGVFCDASVGTGWACAALGSPEAV